MKYSKIYNTDQVLKEEINHLLTHEPRDESEMFSDKDHLSISVRYSDGKVVVVEVCGCAGYRKNECNLPWTQGILYSKEGYELSVTEPCDEFFGEWQFYYLDNLYVLNVS